MRRSAGTFVPFRALAIRKDSVMPMSLAAAVVGLQLSAPLPSDTASPIQVQQQCGNGYDIDIYGRCFPNEVIPPRYQAARQVYGGRYGGGPFRVATAPISIFATDSVTRTAKSQRSFSRGATSTTAMMVTIAGLGTVTTRRLISRLQVGGNQRAISEIRESRLDVFQTVGGLSSIDELTSAVPLAPS